MKIPTSALRIDWTNLDEVIALANKFGPGQVVVKHAGRANYNITHQSRRDRWDVPNVTVVYTTG